MFKKIILHGFPWDVATSPKLPRDKSETSRWSFRLAADADLFETSPKDGNELDMSSSFDSPKLLRDKSETSRRRLFSEKFRGSFGEVGVMEFIQSEACTCSLDTRCWCWPYWWLAVVFCLAVSSLPEVDKLEGAACPPEVPSSADVTRRSVVPTGDKLRPLYNMTVQQQFRY